LDWFNAFYFAMHGLAIFGLWATGRSGQDYRPDEIKLVSDGSEIPLLIRKYIGNLETIHPEEWVLEKQLSLSRRTHWGPTKNNIFFN